MGRIVAYAKGKSTVVRVIGILLFAGFIDVIRVSVGPRLNRMVTVLTHPSHGICHSVPSVLSFGKQTRTYAQAREPALRNTALCCAVDLPGFTINRMIHLPTPHRQFDLPPIVGPL